MHEKLLTKLRGGETAVWLKSAKADFFDAEAARADVAAAEIRWQRFAPALARLFDTPGGLGRINSPLSEYPASLPAPAPVYVKADHSLPITACVKARGGIFGLLCVIEKIAQDAGLLKEQETYAILADEPARRILAEHTVVVASTGNLGYSIGVAAIGFGMQAEVHMSDDAKEWKKARLRELGATVVEHVGDYTSTVSSARTSVAERDKTHFIDDENSWDLFVGYAGAGEELAQQLKQANVDVSVEHPLVVYLPCGVGGAPGGITYGLKSIFGDAVVCVFVEPVNSACVFVALACDGALKSVYDVGLSNNTEADGLAVSRASELVLNKVGKQIDAVVAVPDKSMTDWVGKAWSNAALRLEPSATAGFAALEPFLQAIDADVTSNGTRPALKNIAQGTHVVWTTGGDLMPEDIFQQFL
ncbi:D-serine ammonia-lyase [Woeseia oceani]|uniref:Probable D-serine dehydratase n=1 Tax=Woeseia oceani TaxID=1548547 RepID=A0A193LJ69_9GAMM|nr:D-serine ammonia-lyase [Woeseia oceani]ANO52580.1 hypothetical protein BA177_16555 [Woeseia oceani]